MFQTTISQVDCCACLAYDHTWDERLPAVFFDDICTKGLLSFQSVQWVCSAINFCYAFDWSVSLFFIFAALLPLGCYNALALPHLSWPR